jgi:hypothetical protein
MRRGLIGAVLLLGLMLASAAPAAAHGSGYTSVAALSGSVEDACTHRALPAVQFLLTDPNGVIIPVQKPGGGRFRVDTLTTPGTYHFTASAPGYLSLSQGNNPVSIIVPPAATGLPPGVTLSTGLYLDVALQPLSTRRNCAGGFPLSVPGLQGFARDITTGKALPDMRCAVKNPLNGKHLKGPGCFAFHGHFLQAILPPGTWSLWITSPGHTDLTLPIVQPPRPHSSHGFVAAGLVAGVGDPGSGPPPVLPEAPYAALLVLPAAGAFGLVMWRRRAKRAVAA